MHDAGYLKDHPDAAPVGADGQASPPPDGWQGICPTHPGYREAGWRRSRPCWSASRSTASGSTTTTATRAGSRPCPTCPTPASATAACAGSRTSRACGCPTADRGAGRAAARHAPPGVDAVAHGRVHRLGPRVPDRFCDARARRRCWGRSTSLDATTTSTARAGEAGDRPAGAGRLPRRLQPDALPRPLRPRRRPGLDLAAGRLAGPPPGRQGQARRDGSASGRSCSSPTGASRSRWHRSPVIDHGTRAPATGVMVFAWSGLRKHPEKVEAIGRTFRAFRGPQEPSR